MTNVNPLNVPTAPFKRFRAAVLASLAFVLLAGACGAEPAKARLEKVERWLLLLNDSLEPDSVARVARSTYDMAVVDDVGSLAWNVEFPVAATVAALKRRPGDARGSRLVLAYLNVGQAEDYRAYFRAEWKDAAPDWILGDDPEGWAGNFPVAYWHAEWRAIVVALARAIARAGYDGAYLDWVAGYQHDPVVARATAEGVNARAAMIDLVDAVGRAARLINPDFLVVVQNVPEFADEPALPAIADAIAQEHIWFDGTEGNDPPGDCPMPQTYAEAGTQGHLAALPAPCRRAWNEGRAGTLRYAVAERAVPLLSRARERGLAVLTVDYAAEPANVARAARLSRALGFKPFVGTRGLDRFVPPPQ